MWRCQIIWVMLNSNHKFVDSESSQNHQMFSIRITDLVRAESELSCKNVLWFKPRDCRINCFPINYNHMCSLFLTNCWIFQFPQYSSSRGTSQEILVWIELIKTNHSNVQPSDPAKNATSSHRIIFKRRYSTQVKKIRDLNHAALSHRPEPGSHWPWNWFSEYLGYSLSDTTDCFYIPLLNNQIGQSPYHECPR